MSPYLSDFNKEIIVSAKEQESLANGMAGYDKEAQDLITQLLACKDSSGRSEILSNFKENIGEERASQIIDAIRPLLNVIIYSQADASIAPYVQIANIAPATEVERVTIGDVATELMRRSEMVTDQQSKFIDGQGNERGNAITFFFSRAKYATLKAIEKHFADCRIQFRHTGFDMHGLGDVEKILDEEVWNCFDQIGEGEISYRLKISSNHNKTVSEIFGKKLDALQERVIQKIEALIKKYKETTFQ